MFLCIHGLGSTSTAICWSSSPFAVAVENMAPAERRYDPADGATYTYDEVFTYYRSMNLGKQKIKMLSMVKVYLFVTCNL